MSVQQLRETMTLSEFRTWAVYLSKVPAPEEKTEFGLASIVAQMWNQNRSRAQPAKPLREFVLFPDPWAATGETGDDVFKSALAAFSEG